MLPLNKHEFYIAATLRGYEFRKAPFPNKLMRQFMMWEFTIGK